MTAGRIGARRRPRRATSWCSPRRTRRPWSARSGSPSTPPSTCRCGCRCSPATAASPRSRSPSPRSASPGPTPEQFRFNPPPGATVTEESADSATKPGARIRARRTPESRTPESRTRRQGDQDKRTRSHCRRFGLDERARGPPARAAPATDDPNAGGGAGPGAGPDVNDAMRMLERLPKVSGAWGSGRTADQPAVQRAASPTTAGSWSARSRPTASCRRRRTRRPSCRE